MNYLSRDEIENELLKMLSIFHNLCMDNNLRYSLAAGTLLGAIRHHGFIPWDDDVDVMMPRADFERLKMLEYKLPNGFRFSDFGSFGSGFRLPYLKLINTSIRAQEDVWEGVIEEYLWIDIFPLDKIPSDETLNRKIIRKQKNRLSLAFLVAGNQNAYRGYKRAIKKFISDRKSVV